MPVSALSPVRRSISPVPGDDWASIAQRHLTGLGESAAIEQLQSWNLHVYMRSTRQFARGNPILPSDIIFIEPPLAKK
jgi:hypothetical protein